ncbi:MAG: lysophospholipid acyltransferase family protein [Candidatus Eremiobacteraeota bacterium]|nr:lysophospholipid acyltransferase family protein [Candidatus Eremiobacteraeota bacterium]
MFYTAAHIILKVIFKVFFSLKCEGLHHIPSAGGCVIACNHVSYFDPPAVGAVSVRPVHFMAKKELFNIPILSPLISVLGAFPVTRGASDTKAIKHAIRLLKSGETVGIFPEGTRSATGEINEGEMGVSLIIKQSGAPIIPCAISGTRCMVTMKGIIPVFSKVTVRFGPPIFYKNEEEGMSHKEYMRVFTDRVMQVLRSLQEG